MKSLFKSLKKQWLLVWCAVIAFSLVTMIASAEYGDAKSTMKRVVRSTSDQGKMFSSNVLIENGTGTYVPNYKQELAENDKATSTYDVDIYLWNYSVGNISKWYPTDIDYKITLTFTHTNGEPLNAGEIKGRSVSLVKGNSATPLLTLNSTTAVTSDKQTLSHSSAQSAEDHYKLKYSGEWDLEKDTDICVKMEAVPYKGTDAAKYQDLSAISAIIGLKQSVNIGASGWEAYLAESQNGVTSTKTNECDAFNLVATGSGKAIITIKWDTTHLECNKYFCNSAVNVPGESKVYQFGTYVDAENAQTREVEYSKSGDIATLTIVGDTGTPLYSNPADSNAKLDNKNRYDIQFYKVTGPSPSTDWSFCSVTYSNTITEPNGNTWLTVNVKQ